MIRVTAKSRGSGGEGTWVNVCQVYAAGLSEPPAHHSLFCGQYLLQTASQSLLAKYVIFVIPIQSLSIFYELTHFLDGMKNTLLFICSTNILVRLLNVNTVYENVQPLYSQSNCEKAIPSSRTSPLASHEEVPPPSPPGAKTLKYKGYMQKVQTQSTNNSQI